MRKTGLFYIFLCLAAVCGGQIVTLSNGSVIQAEVLAERAGGVVVDLGFTVLMIPKENVLSVKDEVAEAAEASAESDEAAVISSKHLYRTADLTVKPLQENYETVSPGVVKVSTPAGLGSGFFINEDGYLITNYHVIEQETLITVTQFEKSKTGFEKKNYKKVRIIALNPFVDLALLKVEEAGGDFPFVTLGAGSEVAVGQNVFAVGNPLGLERSLSEGAITTVSRAFEGLVYLQTNADINPGNSGGPLFNMKGQVIGVTNMGAVFYGGLGFAIPVEAVKDFIRYNEAFAYDKDNPNSGYRYLQPDERLNKDKPDLTKF
ncbi:MAG: S1C family serine protease [Planctomycetota bacterium]|jgi:serine protease Do